MFGHNFMTLFFGYCSLAIFSLDIIIKFNTAIYKLGILSYDKIDIMNNYLKK